MPGEQLFFEFGSPYQPPPLAPAPRDSAPPPADAPPLEPLDPELPKRISRKVARKRGAFALGLDTLPPHRQGVVRSARAGATAPSSSTRSTIPRGTARR